MAVDKDLTAISGAFDLTKYSRTEYQNAVTRILEHNQSAIKFQAMLSSASDAVLTGNYSLGRISHSYFTRCTFVGASLESVAGAGSIFNEVIFNGTDLQSANFQNSTFNECEFNNCKLFGSNLGSSYFKDVSWYRCPQEKYNVGSSYFKKCSFIETTPGNLADSHLNEVSFENVRLTNINIEYSSFSSVSAKNTVFPFSQMPYVFNGLQYLLETHDKIRISSKANSRNSISIHEYTDILQDMIIFYSYHKEYFPLANILIAFKRFDDALSVLLQGIVSATLQRDFRMCKYYCKLLTENGQFSINTLHTFYRHLCQAAPIHSLTEAQYYQYLQHMPDIRTMLIENPANYPHATFSLKTQIDCQDSKKISLVLGILDELIHLKESNLINQQISIAHNSPLVIIVPLCGPVVSILAVCAIILTVITSVCKSYNEVAEAIINTQIIGENAHKNEQALLEKQKLQREIEKIELENTELREKINAHRQEIKDSGIVIAHADLIAEDFNPMLFLK